MAQQKTLFAPATAVATKAPPARSRSATRPKSSRTKRKVVTKRRSSGGAANRTVRAVPRRPGSSARGGPAPGKKRTRAHDLADKAREISVSEFFAKNRHLLGYDSKRKALLSTVKEAVDNALDACEEADILPDIAVTIEEAKGDDRYTVTVADNGPGILPDQIDLVFAKLLYGSKFHRLRQSRGQQGIGISAAGMYGQMTTGKPTVIRSCIGHGHDAIEVATRVDTTRNVPKRVREKVIEWDRPHGTEVCIDLVGRYQRGKGSVDEYLAQTAIANPHVQITYRPPGAKEPVVYRRVTREPPVPPKEIRPHPHGVELGVLMKMMKSTRSTRLGGFLQGDFSRVSARVAHEICEKAGLSPTARVKSLEHVAAEALHDAIQKVKIMNPPTDCLSPIGEDLLRTGLKKEIGEAEFFVSCTRAPAVYRGNPFQVEVGMALGGSLPSDEPVRVLRLANRVPLQYQQGACAITKAMMSVDWRGYKLQQPRGSLPIGPVIVMVHIASAWVPFTSESKEAVASYSEILKELKLALQDCGRQMQKYLRRRQRVADEMKKRSYIDSYIPHIGQALRDILDLDEKKTKRLVDNLRDTLERSRKL